MLGKNKVLKKFAFIFTVIFLLFGIVRSEELNSESSNMKIIKEFIHENGTSTENDLQQNLIYLKEDNQANIEENDEEEVKHLPNLKFWDKHACTDELSDDQLEKVNSFIELKSITDEKLIKQLKFVASDCNPVVLVPGLYSTILRYHVYSCKLMKMNHPDIYSQCYTDRNKDCNDGEEERLFMSENFTKDSDKSGCFGRLLSLNLKEATYPQEKIEKGEVYEELYQGFRVTYYGDTPETKEYSKCGINASINLLDKFSSVGYFGNKNANLWRYVVEKLEKDYGYTAGLNLFNIPHDWRNLPNSKMTNDIMKDTIDLAYNINKKKIVFLTHSLGSLITYNHLVENMTQSEKDLKVQKMVNIAPPFLGAMKAVKPAFFATNEMDNKVKYLINLLDVEFSLKNQREYYPYLPISLQLIPSSFWNNQKDEAWVNALLGEIEVEDMITDCVDKNLIEGKSSEHDAKQKCYHNMLKLPEIIEKREEFSKYFPFFPGINEECYIIDVNNSNCRSSVQDKDDEKKCVKTFWDAKCKLSMFIPLKQVETLREIRNLRGKGEINYFEPEDFNEYKILSRKIKQEHDENLFQLRVEGESIDFYDQEELRKIFLHKGLVKLSQTYVEWILKNKNEKQPFNTMPHPGIDSVLILNNSMSTPIRFDLVEDPKKVTNSGKIYDNVYKETSYATYKGGDSTVPSDSSLGPFLKWSLNNDFTTEVVHYCTNGDARKEVLKNTGKKNIYQQINCDCTSGDDLNCSHAAMTSDSYVLNYFTKNHIKIDEEERFIEKVESRLREVYDLVQNKIEEFQCSNLKSWDDYKKSYLS